MQLKTTLFAACLLFIGGAFFWSWTPTVNEEDSSAGYTPREAVSADEEPFGASEIRRLMAGDVETGAINEAGLLDLREEVNRFAQQQVEAGDRTVEHYWNELGPDNIGGRTRAIVAITENTLLTGGVSGGLWRSETAGNNWVQVHGFPHMMVSSIAVAGNGDIYVGTGSLFDYAGGDGNSGFRGRGIWYSNDNGETFTMVDGTDPGAFSNGDFSATDAVEADPNNGSRIWYGSNGGFGAMDNGVMADLDVEGLPPGTIADIAIAADGTYMLVAMANSRVYRSTNATFTDFVSVSGNPNTGPFLPQSGVGRCRIDISMDDSNHAYAVYAANSGLFAGMYHSGDGGNTWQVEWPGGIATSTPLPRGQGIYDLALGIKKGNPEVAFVGGIELWRSGVSQQAELAAIPYDFIGFDDGVHADVHEIIFTPAGTMYVATDGGIYKSTDGGETYLACNRDYSVTQFYGMDISANSAVIGGTQDNGTLMILGNGYFLSNQEAIDVNGGDGFDCAISHVTEAAGYEYAYLAASQNGGHARGTVGPGAVNNYGSYYDENIADLVNEEGELGQFYSVVRLYENMDDPDAQSTVILVNPHGQTVTDSTFTVFTANQNLPFEYTLAEGEELPFYEELIRPERILESPLEEDPDYFWLDPQTAVETLECNVDSTFLGTDSVIVDIIPILDSSYVEEWDEWVYTEIGLDTLYAEVDLYDVAEICDTMYFHASDTLFDVPGQIKVVDPYTTITVLGFNGSNGIWMSRDALNFNTTPKWIRLDNAPAGFNGTKAVEFTVNVEPEAGNYMFVSGWNGKLYRFDDLESIYDQTDVPDNMAKEIHTAGTAITGISVDPNDPNHVVITVGGYGNVSGGKVQESFNALSEDPTWNNIWISSGELTQMPCYDVVIDKMDASGQTMVVGTEYGVFATDNGGDDWTMVNLNMGTGTDQASAPVHDVKQQWRESGPYSTISNEGAIYIATHGRGIFRSDLYLGDDEMDEITNAPQPVLNLYPNPTSAGAFTWQSDAIQGDFVLELFDLNGRVVKSEWVRGYVGGAMEMNIEGLVAGTYIVRAANGSNQLLNKLMVR